MQCHVTFFFIILNKRIFYDVSYIKRECRANSDLIKKPLDVDLHHPSLNFPICRQPFSFFPLLLECEFSWRKHENLSVYIIILFREILQAWKRRDERMSLGRVMLEKIKWSVKRWIFMLEFLFPVNFAISSLCEI